MGSQICDRAKAEILWRQALNLGLFTLGNKRKGGDLIVAHNIISMSNHPNASILAEHNHYALLGNSRSTEHEIANSQACSHASSWEAALIRDSLLVVVTTGPPVNSFRRRPDTHIPMNHPPPFRAGVSSACVTNYHDFYRRISVTNCYLSYHHLFFPSYPSYSTFVQTTNWLNYLLLS